MKLYKYRFVNYFDVWAGDEEGSWQVNNLCEEWVGYLPTNFVDSDLLHVLQLNGFLNDSVELKDIEISDLFPFYEIVQAKDDCPLGRIEILEVLNLEPIYQIINKDTSRINRITQAYYTAGGEVFQIFDGVTGFGWIFLEGLRKEYLVKEHPANTQFSDHILFEVVDREDVF